MNQFSKHFSEDITKLVAKLKLSSSEGFRSSFQTIASTIFNLLKSIEEQEEEKFKKDPNYVKKEVTVLKVPM